MFCTGKEQLTCNSEKMGCEGCFYFNDENNKKINMEEDLKNLIYTIEMHHISSKPIYDLIAENKQLKQDNINLNDKLQMTKNSVVIGNLDVIEDYVPKSKVEEEFERMTSHSNCFNVGDMNDLLDRILN